MPENPDFMQNTAIWSKIAMLKFYKTDSVHKILMGYGQQDICSEVFRLKYIERKSAEDVAEELYIDRRTVFKQLDHDMLFFAYWLADNVYFPVGNKSLLLKELFWVGGCRAFSFKGQGYMQSKQKLQEPISRSKSQIIVFMNRWQQAKKVPLKYCHRCRSFLVL